LEIRSLHADKSLYVSVESGGAYIFSFCYLEIHSICICVKEWAWLWNFTGIF